MPCQDTHMHPGVRVALRYAHASYGGSGCSEVTRASEHSLVFAFGPQHSLAFAFGPQKRATGALDPRKEAEDKKH